MRLLSLLLALSFVNGLAAQQFPNVVPGDPLKPEEERARFKVPEGFEVQLVASEPDIMKPIQMAFDAKGRLWVTTSQEYPFAAEGRPGKDKLFVLEDFDASGKAKKITCFADDLNIPIGIVPLPNGTDCIVHSIPNIWLFKDTDGDGKADKKEILYGPFSFRDTHGMVNSFVQQPDGWIYATHGYLNECKVKGKDGHEVEMKSGHTFRFRPDGSRIEIWTRGQVNPFGMCTDSWGNLYTADCHSKPITQLIRNACYDSFGKPHDGLGYGPNMINHDHGSTALCGLAWYEADQFPAEYKNCMFLGNVVTNRINFDKIEFVGSTPKAIQQPDFLVSSDQWFRPVDIKLGPDGALYVADFYNKIIGHYEVDLKHPGRDKLRGRIWRIVWKGKAEQAKFTPMPKVFGATTAELLKAMSSPNLFVRQQAILQMQAKETQKIRISNITEPQSIALAWTKTVDEALLTKLAASENPQVRIQILQVTGSSTKTLNEEQIRIVVAGLKDTEPRVVRAALQTISLHPAEVKFTETMALIPRIAAEDSHLLHAARVALRDQLLHLEDWSKLSELQDAEQRIVGDVCLGIPQKKAAEFLFTSLSHQDKARRVQFAEHIARHGDEAMAGKLLATCNSLPNLGEGLVMLGALQKGLQQKGARYPEGAIAIAEKMAEKALEENGTAVQAAFDLIGSMKLSKLSAPLTAYVARKDRPEGLRANALTTLAAIDGGKSVPAIAARLHDANESFAVRERAVHTLAAVNNSAAHDELLKALQAAPARLANVIAFGVAISRTGGERLLQAVEQGKASPRLLLEKPVADRLNGHKSAEIGKRMAALTKGVPSVEQRLIDLQVKRRDAFAKGSFDAKLGMEVFTKNCANCHTLGGKGAKVGPQLDGIGVRGLDRLLEDILDPSRNVDQAMRQTRVVKKDGVVVDGLVLREEGEVLILADAQGKDVRIEKSNIEEKRVLATSPMPANLVDIIPEKDFYHLMAFLLQQRAKE